MGKPSFGLWSGPGVGKGGWGGGHRIPIIVGRMV